MIINEERIHDRLDELYFYLENFSDSLLANAVRHEIEYLESLL